MAQRQTISGRRSCLLWLGLLAALVLAVAIVVIVFLVAPQQAEERALARATTEANARLTEVARTAEAAGVAATSTAAAEQAEVERLYQAGVAFQAAGRWDDAIAAFSEVIRRAPDYKDAATRLAEVTAQAQADAQATATAQTQATETAQANATATARAAPTVTAMALAARYRRALGLVNLKQWAEAQAELRAIFDTDYGHTDANSIAN